MDYPNWIFDHNKKENEKDDELNGVCLKADNFLEKATLKSNSHKSAIENKKRKQFLQDTNYEENLFNLANCFFNAGHDCVKQRFTNFIPLQTVVVPTCVNLLYSAKLMMHYILNKFHIPHSQKDSLLNLFSQLPEEIKNHIQSQIYSETSVFLEILEDVNFLTYLINPKEANTHINFHLRFCNILKSISFSINQNLYYL